MGEFAILVKAKEILFDKQARSRYDYAYKIHYSAQSDKQKKSQKKSDIVNWLEKNQLDPFKAYFVETNMGFEDLLIWNDDDMNEIISECNVKAFAYKKRFKHKVKEYQLKSNKSNAAPPTPDKVDRVILTETEAKAMSALKKKFLKSNDSMIENKRKSDRLSQNEKSIESKIKNTFEKIRKRVNERENVLMVQLKELSSKQVNALQNEMNHLTEYQDAIKKARKEQKVVSLDPNLDSTKRQNKILQIADNVLIADKQRADVELNEIVFNVDPNDNATFKNIKTFGNVCVQSNAPKAKKSSEQKPVETSLDDEKEEKEDKKVFDKCISGKGFEFELGKGEVIKGWDLGLKGMKNGGKRKLIVPSKLAYGQRGSEPHIPPNARLTFTLEIKDVVFV